MVENVRNELQALFQERLCEIKNGAYADNAFGTYFMAEATWLCHLFHVWEMVESGRLFELDMEELEALNQENYGEILPGNYEESYANPAYATTKLGEIYGPFFSALHTQMRQGLGYAYDGEEELFLSLPELFLEIYGAFEFQYSELKEEPPYEEIKRIYYSFMTDYAELRSEKQVREMVVPEENEAKKRVMTANLCDLRYLYYFGEYVSDSERKTAAFLNAVSEEKIKTMADTFTEGYRIGFAVTNKDISIKKCAGIFYNLGFERVVREAVKNFEKIGLQSGICRGHYQSLPANRQYVFDHRDDDVLFMDKAYMSRKLETLRVAYEKYKDEARVYGGPAVMEVFGEEPFSPVQKKECLTGDDRYQKMKVEFMSHSRRLRSEYIIEEERSFTIIAFPTPDVGEKFEEIFDEIIRINTLDYSLYQKIQQTIIDSLDLAEYVEIKGQNGNRTDLRVQLIPLNDPEKETKFENCVADVNIPVGEVFTSPRLTGTNGILHVSRVFLNELEYKDLEMHFEDGMVRDYRCKNFEKEEEGKRYIKDNVLMHHDTLPMGEFAIGTNTTAYVMAEKYDIGAKLPILIAEKMGPHFAVGDTCYSQTEDVKVYNPDKKEIMARDNEVSILRKKDPAKAYFNCHTDITIPYHELGLLQAVCEDGTKIEIIRDGRFVLPGTEELNKPFSKFIQN